MNYGWWSGKEIKDVKDWFKNGISIPDIASKIDRDNKSVENFLVMERIIKISDCQYGGY